MQCRIKTGNEEFRNLTVSVRRSFAVLTVRDRKFGKRKKISLNYIIALNTITTLTKH